MTELSLSSETVWLEVEDDFLTDHLKFNYLAGQHFIEQHSKCPPVHRLSIGLISDDLEKRTHPIRAAGSPCGWRLNPQRKSGLAMGRSLRCGPDLLFKVTVADTVPDLSGVSQSEQRGQGVPKLFPHI